MLCFRYIYYFEHENPAIHVRYLSGLIALINEQRDPEGTGVPGGTSAGVDAHYRNTLGTVVRVLFCWKYNKIVFLEYLKNRQKDAETSEKFSAVQLS